VFYVGYRTPGVLAKAACTLDHLSGGRFELGLGGGWHEQEAIAYGYDFPGVKARLDMLDEATQIIRGLLTQDRTTFHGVHFRVEDASCLPRPVQARLPIIVGGVGEKRTLGIVAAQADGWNAAYISPERFGELNAVLDGRLADAGRPAGSVRRGINLMFNLSTTAAGAVAMRDQLAQQWGPAFDRVSAGALLGTPDDAVARVLEYVAAGATDVNIALRAPWDRAALDAYVGEVVPAVRAAVAG
jgi:alkanesulfonate monooxygenase SsuD/methylene tetrahydromethanopterin reductase-like flavin-dependent oxidoreductase (luciferase family)